MVKSAITVLLALLCLLLVKANIDTFRAPQPAQEAETTPIKKSAPKKIRPQYPFDLNPTIPPQLPDLSSGYLFNAQRFLAKEARSSTTAKNDGQNIRMEDVVFQGAILGDGYQKALVSYRLSPQQAVRPSQPDHLTKSIGRPQKITLAVGDQLGGYTVTEITLNFILFEKGSATIKRTLFDSNKKRQQVAPQPPTSSAP